MVNRVVENLRMQRFSLFQEYLSSLEKQLYDLAYLFLCIAEHTFDNRECCQVIIHKFPHLLQIFPRGARPHES